MIPILYDSTETSFSSNGLGRLSDAISCEVAEKRNGTYELKLVYPTNGIHFDQIVAGNYIAAIHSDQKDVQPFRIYRISEEIDGKVEINAHHISYALNSIIAKPFTAGSCAEVITKLNTATTFVNSCPFTFWTDKSVTANLNNVTPRDVRSLLGGASGSLLDVYGTGEYEFDIYDVKLYLHRGSDTEVQIRYGLNMTDYEHTADSSDAYNAIVPFWYDENSGEMVTLPEWYLTPTGQTVTDLRLFALDMSDDFDSKPTESQLRTKAQSKLDNSGAWRPAENWKVSFVQLWQSPEYAEVAPLQRLNLCDTCLVIYNGRSIREKVVETTYDVLRERYISMELGEPKTSFANMVIRQATSEIVKQVVSKSFLDEAIAHATDLITGALGGYLVIGTNANGQPNELLIMDNPDKTQAVNVWRFNSGGLGHSHDGYSGPFSDIALTMDGKINAARIITGILNANVIRAGIIADTQNKNSWNLETGQLITTLGQIGGWTISDSGIYKEITSGNNTFRVVLQSPVYTSTYFLRVQKLKNNLWYTLLGISIDDGLTIVNETSNLKTALFGENGIIVNNPTNGMERFIANGSGVYIYNGELNNVLKTAISGGSFTFYNDNEDPVFHLYGGMMKLTPTGSPSEYRYEYDINGLRFYYQDVNTVNLASWGDLFLYDTNGNNLFTVSGGTSLSPPAVVIDCAVRPGTNGIAIGELNRPFGVVCANGIEVIGDQTGLIDFHYDGSQLDYTSRIIETASGVLSINGQVIGTSDKRLKDNIEDVSEEELALLGKLKPRTYNYNKSEFKSAGLVAQEVLEAEEELGIDQSVLVRGTGGEIPDPKHPGETMTDYYGVDYNGLTSLLLAQVQKLTKQVEDLTVQVSALKNGKA